MVDVYVFVPAPRRLHKIHWYLNPPLALFFRYIRIRIVSNSKRNPIRRLTRRVTEVNHQTQDDDNKGRKIGPEG